MVFGVLAQTVDNKLRDLLARQNNQETWNTDYSAVEKLTTGTWNALANKRPSVTFAMARASVILAILADHSVRLPSP